MWFACINRLLEHTIQDAGACICLLTKELQMLQACLYGGGETSHPGLCLVSHNSQVCWTHKNVHTPPADVCLVINLTAGVCLITNGILSHLAKQPSLLDPQNAHALPAAAADFNRAMLLPTLLPVFVPPHPPFCSVCSVPSLGKRGYTFLKEDKGFSDTAIISGVLLLPLTFGALFICVLDALYTRSNTFDPHEHYE